jgi:hypothetical protein
MVELKSGKELCDEFFKDLPMMKDVDPQITKLLKDLYEEGKFTSENILKGLATLREDKANNE